MDYILLFLEGISNFFGFFGDTNFAISDALGLISGLGNGFFALIGAFQAAIEFFGALAGLLG